MASKRKHRLPDEPLCLNSHGRPVTRRDFLAQGLVAGLGMVTAPTLFGLFANPRSAAAALSPDIELLKTACGIKSLGAGKIPFICFDLDGGANFAGSNVLVGQQGGQLDFLSTAGYSKLGLPGDMTPGSINPATNTGFINTDFGLGFHANSALLQGIQEKARGRSTEINGAVIPARSDNDTANNPHNPMYGIARAGSDGSLLSLIAALLTARVRRPFLAPLPPILVNAVGLSFYLPTMAGLPFIGGVPYLSTFLAVGIGQTVACYFLGYPLLMILLRRKHRGSGISH